MSISKGFLKINLLNFHFKVLQKGCIRVNKDSNQWKKVMTSCYNKKNKKLVNCNLI